MKAANPALPILLAVCIGFLGNAKADSIDFITHKGALLERLDSIDMEKQLRKRKGLSLEELEAKSLLIKDSIAALKNGIRLMDGKPASTAARAQPRKKAVRFLPGNAFDWIVFVFASIAIIAGAILCIGLFSMVWKTMATKKKPPLTTMRESLSLCDERARGEQAASRDASASEIPESAMDALKKRINAATTDAPAPAPPAAPSASPTPGDHDVKAAVIKAASEGAGIAEISRRFHVGADQVSLILRVSRQDTAHQEDGENR